MLEESNLQVKQVNHFGHFNNMETSRMQITIRPMRKPKRFRSAFSTEQISFLEQQFKKFPYISCEHRKELAAALNMQERAIKIWFQNRRMKEKKETNYKELEVDYETANRVDGQDRIINKCTLPSANEQVAYSLPIVVKPVRTVDTHTTVYKANTDSGQKEAQCRLRIQQTPQNLSMKHNQAPLNLKHDPNIKLQKPTEPLTPCHAIQRGQLKNKNPLIHKKPAEFSVSKKLKKEINHLAYPDQKGKLQKRFEPGHSTAAKIRTAPEDLSSNKKLRHQALSKQPKQVKVSSPAYYPMMPTVYAHPYISTGSMIWKPLNVMPVMPTGTTIASNIQQYGPDQKRHCSCNCHESAQSFTVPPNPISPYAQYVITPSPYQNSSSKFQ